MLQTYGHYPSWFAEDVAGVNRPLSGRPDPAQ